MTTKIGLVQLGCAKNQVDGEEILGVLAETGDVQFVSEKQNADVLIVNTCGFIDAAKEESINAILDAVKLKKRGIISKVVVTGCLAQRYGSDLAKEIPEVDVFLGIESAPQISNVVFDKTPRIKNQVQGVTDKFPLIPPSRLRATGEPWTAYLKISEGCDHTCTFCAIPGIRGKHRSKPIERLVSETEQLVASGAKEINLVSQDTTAYGMDLYGQLVLPDLLESLSNVEGLQWIRLLYCYPTMVRQPLIDAMRSLPKVLPYIDMPLQHGDDEMLSRMKRGGSVDQYHRLFEKLRNAIPNLALRTTFLVGYPGETDEHVENLIRFIEDIRFDRVGVFTFSAEEGTPAYNVPGQIPAKIMKQRRDAVMKTQQEISLERNQEQVGRDLDIIIEKAKGNSYVGRSYRDAPEIDGNVICSTGDIDYKIEPGSIISARITNAEYYDLSAIINTKGNIPAASNEKRLQSEYNEAIV